MQRGRSPGNKGSNFLACVAPEESCFLIVSHRASELIFNFIAMESELTERVLHLSRKSVNQSNVAGKTGISKSRLSELSNNESTILRADELYLIALAIDVDPCEILKEVCSDLKLESEN